MRGIGPEARVRSASGGNQQKVMFARWLLADPPVLIADEPTRGVDVGSKRTIYDLLAAQAAAGMGVLIVSSEMEEVLGLAHRILVMRNGRLVADIDGETATEEIVVALAFGTVPAGADRMTAAVRTRRPGRRDQRPRRLLVDYAILWVVLALFVFLALTTPRFLTEPNLRNILDQQSLVLIAASVATLTMIAGGFDVSQGAVYVAAPLMALWVENQTGNIAAGGRCAGLGFGLVVGIVNGAIVTVAKINSFIATLAVSFIIFGIGYIVSDGAILRPVDQGVGAPRAHERAGHHVRDVDRAIVVVAVSWFALARTRYGRYVYAVGGNAEAARLTGVRVRWIVGSVFVLAALAAALAGVLRSSRSISATPRTTCQLRVRGHRRDRGRRHVDRRRRGHRLAHRPRRLLHRPDEQRVQPQRGRPHLPAHRPGPRDPGRRGHRRVVRARAEPSRTTCSPVHSRRRSRP